MTWIRPTPLSLVAFTRISLVLVGPFRNAARVARASFTKLTRPQAQQVTEDATRIRAVLGCR